MFKKMALVALLSLAVPGLALADEGFLVGGGLGATHGESGDRTFGNFSDTATGWKGFAGYEFNYWALEVAYVDLGNLKDDGLSVEGDAITYSVLGLIPYTDRMDITLKLGYFDAEYDFRILGVSGDTDGEGIVLGAGLRYSFSDHFLVRGEFDWFEDDNSAGDLEKVWYLGAAIEFKF